MIKMWEKESNTKTSYRLIDNSAQKWCEVLRLVFKNESVVYGNLSNVSLSITID